MKRFFLFILSVVLGGSAFANHWTPNPHQFPTNMNVIATLEINGIEQTSESLELGAFYGTECRGSEILAYYDVLDRYLFFLTLHGEYGDVFTFRLYDHETQQELELTSNQTVAYSPDAIIGTIHDPYVFSFTGGGSCTITTLSMPEEGGVVLGGGTYLVGESCTVSAISNDGYFFTAWMENGDTISTESEHRFAVTGDRTLTACFDATFTIDASPNPENAGIVTGMGTYYQNETCVLSATPNEGFSFVNWTEDGTVVSTDSEYSFIVTANRSLIANFSINNYSITAESLPAEGGNVSGTGQYDYGSLATLNAIPNETYFFINWTEDSEIVSIQPEYSFQVTGDRHLVATFAQSCFVVQADVEPAEGGYVTGAGNYVEGSTCHLSAHPTIGYAFVSWTEDGEVISIQPEFSFVVESDRHLVAHFEIMYYEITATVDPENGGEIDGAGTYAYGQTATLVARPNVNYVFKNWSENGNVVSESSRYSFTVVGNRSLVACFYYFDEVVESEEQWSIFPNPTEGMVRIEGLPQSIVCVYDTNGKLMLSEKVTSDSYRLDLSSLPSGRYLLQIQSSTGIHCQKIIKR